MTFADPRNDVAFKKIFGDENKKEMDVCNSVALRIIDDINVLKTGLSVSEIEKL